MIVTTAREPDGVIIERARRLAEELHAPYAPRRTDTIAGLGRKRGAARVLVVGESELKLVQDGAPPLFFHPSMALIRVKRLRAGGRDALVEAAGVREGDAVLDCTAGLGADAIVLSYAAGPSGRVDALEKSAVLHAIVREGLRTYVTGLPDVDAAMRRVRPIRADLAAYLAGLPDRAYDVLYFDPMFRVPVRSSSSLEPLRPLAEERPLSPEAVAQARRVARRRIVLKDHRDSGEFDRLGFRRVRSSTSAVAYGVIEIDPSTPG